MPEDYIGSASPVPSPSTVDGSGNGSIGATIGGGFSSLSQAVQSALNAIAATFGIAPASASSYDIMVIHPFFGPLPIGYIDGPPGTLITGAGLVPTMNLLGYGIDGMGFVVNLSKGDPAHPSAANITGHVSMDSLPAGIGGARIGEINVESLVEDVTTNTAFGPAVTAGIPNTVSGVLNTLDGAIVRRTTRLWKASVCDTLGRSILGTQMQYNLLFGNGQVDVFMHPSLVAGHNGTIWHWPSNQCIIPRIGGQSSGFPFGGTSDYAPTYVAIGWTALGPQGQPGRTFMWDYYGRDNGFVVIDPITGLPPVIAGWALCKMWAGSQRLTSVGRPSDWQGAAPSAANPGLNTVTPGKIAYTVSGRHNNFFINSAPPSDPGRPDGSAGTF